MKPAGSALWGAAMFALGAAASQAGDYWALTAPNGAGAAPSRAIVEKAGVPFLTGGASLDPRGEGRIDLSGQRVKRIFLLGMTNTTKARSWAHPRDYPDRFFIGDEVGRIRLDYADGSTQVFPLVLGESVWWGKWFADNPEPFPSSARFRAALASALRLLPAAPAADGNYLAAITPRPGAIRQMAIEAGSPDRGFTAIAAITVELPGEGDIALATALPHRTESPELARFVAEKSLRAQGDDEADAGVRLERLRRLLYTSEADFAGSVAPVAPTGYTGPRVSFRGNIIAEILSNAFAFNLQDMADKVGADGAYHTSTLGSRSWGAYNGFGTYRLNLGKYYGQAWCRDLGRSLQELTALGYTAEGARCADYCLRLARRWEEDPALRLKGVALPRHWGRVINQPDKAAAFENDGHGLTTVFLYQLWQRLPVRDAWLRSRWVDVKGAGDWILWQFDHPEISGATDVLHTTSECSVMNGFSVYADAVCRDALVGLAEMADSIGEGAAARRWRARAELMRVAIGRRYVAADPKFGRAWTLESAGWPNQSSVLGPLIFLADTRGFAPEDENPAWRPINAATYERLIATNHPFGFYGAAMGYGQGFVTQSALLLDRMRDATRMLEWTAREIYDPKVRSYIVPEGCELDPGGRFWYRIGDEGNGVQEAEIVKTLRVMIGVDDTRPERLRVYPRLPYGWTEMAVENYPILGMERGKMKTACLRYKLERLADGRLSLAISADRAVGPVELRLGPFAMRPEAVVAVNGRLQNAAVEHSGDAWWVKLTQPVGPEP